MTSRVLLVEPDDTARALMARAIAADGVKVIAARGLADAPADGFDVAIVDELAGGAPVLDEARGVRRRHPAVPLIVTGTLLGPALLVDLLRLGAVDALRKPFTPSELRDAVVRARARAAAGRDHAVTFAAAIADARDALGRGAPEAARAPLAAARAISAFDAEAMALAALAAELEGADDDADRGYRAALALRQDEGTPPPDPSEALKRLARYAGAVPAARLPCELIGAPATLIGAPADAVRPAARAEAPEPRVLVVPLGISLDATGVYVRATADRAFVLLGCAAMPEPVAAALDRAGVGRLAAPADVAADLDLGRVERLRRPPGRSPMAVVS